MIDTSNALDMPGRAGSIRKELIDEEMFPFDWFEFERPRSNVLYDKHRLKLKDFAVLQATLEGQAFVGLDCAENVTALDVLALDAAGDVIKASKGDANKSKVIGFAATTTTLGNLVRVITGGELSGFAGLTINALVYLDTDGGYTQTYGDIGTGEYVVVLGVATAVDTIQISIHQPLIWDKYDGPTYGELQDGYVQAGGNITPTVPTIAICRAVATKAIELKWDRQLNLTNFDRYEVQVSSDDATWYSLEFDGSDWKDTLNADTDWQVETLIHPNIPHGGVASAPTGTTLYYRVRRVTKVPAVSAWSVSASTTTNTVAAGDLAADSIYANNIIAAQALIMLLRSAQLWIGYDGTGSYDSPDEGDRRIYLDGDEIRFQIYTDGAWSSERQLTLGGVDSNGNFRPFLSCRGICGDIDDAPIYDPAPVGSYRFDFEDDLEDENGVDPWTIDSGAAAYSATHWEGAKSLVPAADVPLEMYWVDAWAKGVGVSFFTVCRFRVSALGTATPLFQMGLYPADAEYIDVTMETTGEIKTFVNKATGGDGDYTATGLMITAGTWHLLAVCYNATTDTLTVYLNDNESSRVIGGTWGVPENLALWLTPTYSPMCYFDDLICNFTAALSSEIYYQHYERNVAWTTSISAEDLLLQPRLGGAVRILGQASISDLTSYANNAAAIAGGLSVGDLYRISDTVGVVH